MPATLIADSGATKCEWRLAHDASSNYYYHRYQSLFFVQRKNSCRIRNRTAGQHTQSSVNKVAFYGTGLGNADNVKLIKGVLRKRSRMQHSK